MPITETYISAHDSDALAKLVKAVDRDVERGEDILMLGFATVMLSSTLAPIAPPSVLLPGVALVFTLSSVCAHFNSRTIEKKLCASLPLLSAKDRLKLSPIIKVFKEHPMPVLADAFNFFKNPKRTLYSVLGGLLINPFWMPILYMMFMHISEEQNLIKLNHAVCAVELAHLPQERPDQYSD
ncbi:hypothetical protein [Methylocucumis oryzae]|uniref:Uncharacterized protein n=1 Tax=Methylocucumis oryzae TaxID=1632867 RepID=A0A0F3IG82_9GAMM|nr:hypothetical protein [Methylocucumis oryzae]KJV05810.1 hypothetical protein VZ94_15450 [Methylocucumis oryzae]